MSKSKGNVFTIPDLVARGHKPEAIRYLLCQAHYRKKLNFTWEGLQHAGAALTRIHGFARRLDEVDREGPLGQAVGEACARAADAFDEALCDDMNSPEALAAVHGLVGEGNALLAAGAVTREGASRLREALASMDAVFGVLLPSSVERLSTEEQALLEERQEARRRRDFARADAARARLEALGVVLEDTAKGTRWRRGR
jgi:cysteinyl-tRNA synthetase